jgi:transposase-like protein
MMLVALGIGESGDKQVLGLRQGATENAQVVTSLLEELQQRGLPEVLQSSLVFGDGAWNVSDLLNFSADIQIPPPPR